eukprot:scaffold34685_cov183-Amphora_coffeaeformis.AAC.44
MVTQQQPEQSLAMMNGESSVSHSTVEITQQQRPEQGCSSGALHTTMAGQDSYPPNEIIPDLSFNDGHTFTLDGKPRPTSLVRAWPSMLMYLISESQDDDWLPVIRRIITHPEEIMAVGKNSGMTALHSACISYPPVHIVKAMLTTCPEVALQQNFSGETPLHLASYSASEEVQECLLETVPEAASYRDQYGDSPLHFAARAGATLPLLQKMVNAFPDAISRVNKRGVTPFWLLSRSFLQADDLEEILDDDIEDDDFRHDWDAMVLFLRYTYFGKERAAQMIARGEGTSNVRKDYSWLVHAAASTPACPRDVLSFLCRLFPEQALQHDEQGCTPLQLVVRSAVLDEPKHWNESEDGYREPVEPSHNTKTQKGQDEVAVPVAESVEETESQEAKKDDEDQDAEKSALDILLEWNPKSINVRDLQGRLPLTNALVTGQGWEMARTLMDACPSSMEELDPVTGFSHSQVAAVYSSDINSIFALVRAMPEHISTTTPTSKRPMTACEQKQPSAKRCRLF